MARAGTTSQDADAEAVRTPGPGGGAEARTAGARACARARRDARRYRANAASWSPADGEHANAIWLGEFAMHEASEVLGRRLLCVRRTVVLLVGGALVDVSVALTRTAQIEGLSFGLVAGVRLGPVTHSLIGKVAVPLGAGRSWCGWACWTVALLDHLPFRRSPGWSSSRARRRRTLHLATSAVLVAALALLLDDRGGAVGPDAALWLLVGNAGCWLLGLDLAGPVGLLAATAADAASAGEAHGTALALQYGSGVSSRRS